MADNNEIVTEPISIHALREEGDASSCKLLPYFIISIHALREEGDISFGKAAVADFISIHALREEGDSFSTMHRRPTAYFYPRPPRGGRRGMPLGVEPSQQISIHALREEGDLPSSPSLPAAIRFLSTPSARRATP